MGIVQDVQIGQLDFISSFLPEEEMSALYPVRLRTLPDYVDLPYRAGQRSLRQGGCGGSAPCRPSGTVQSFWPDDLSAEAWSAACRGELDADYGIFVFIFVFSLINLANTLITDLLTRQQEFGVFQSVGMSDRQLSNMLSLECLYYVGITLLVTLTLGTVCSLAVCRVFDQIGLFGTLTYHFPVLQVLLFAAALLLVQGVFSACAVRYTRRLSLVERIKAVD